MLIENLRQLLPKPLRFVIRHILGSRNTDIWSNTLLFHQIRRKHKKLLQQLEGKKKIRVVFLVIHRSIWKVDPVFKGMLEDPFFDPVIFVCPYTQSGDKQMWDDLRESLNYFQGKGYPTISSYDTKKDRWLTLNDIEADIVFFTNPYNLTRNEYHKDAYLNYLTCYVPYYFMGTKHVGSPEVEHVSTILTAQWLIFWPHDFAQEESKKHSVTKGLNGVVTGYPAIERYFFKESSNTDWDLGSKGKRKIIYAPHHTIPVEGRDEVKVLSTFLDLGIPIKNLAERYSEKIFWSFKPHPLLRANLYKHPDWGKERTDLYYEFWASSSFTQYNDGSYEGLFIGSDAILHDCSSFLIEYAFTYKPRLYLVNENTPNLVNDFGYPFFEEYDKARSDIDIARFLEKLITSDLVNDRNYQSQAQVYYKKYCAKELPSKQVIRMIKGKINAWV